MEGRIEELLGDPIQLTESVRKAVEEADSFKQDCIELNDRVDKLAHLLRSAARLFSGYGSSGGSNKTFYDRPARRIMVEVTKTLDRALTLCKKCKRTGVLKRVMNIISAADFRKVNSALDAAIGDVRWLLNVSANGEGRTGIEGLPPIASTDPMLAWVWGQVALVYSGSPAEKEEGANTLASLAADNDRNCKLIIAEGGVSPLLKLLREGTTVTGRLAAANAIGTLAADEERVQQILGHGAVSVFVHILQEAPMKLQAKVAWVIAKMVSEDPEAQSALAIENIIRPLVSLLVFQTMDENLYKAFRGRSLHSVVKSTMIPKSPTILEGKGRWDLNKSFMSDNGRLGDQWDAKSTFSDFYGTPWDSLRTSPQLFSTPDLRPRQIHHSRGFSDSYYNGISSRELARKERENEDPETKRDLKAQVTCALWKLAENNAKGSRKITDTKALICLSKLVEKETGEVQRNSIMALMEIAGAAERDVELRRFAFKTNSPAAKAVVEQLLRVIELGEPDLQVPCLKALGCLSRTFPAREAKVIAPLVRCLSHSEAAVAAEAAMALQKFAHTDNFLHLEHSKTIVDAEAIPRLVQLVTMDDKDVQVPAVILLSYLAIHTGNCDVFRETAALKALKALSRSNVSQIQSVSEVLTRAIQHLELYQAAPQSHGHGYY